MFDEYDTFLLAQPLTDTTIPVGTRGVVLIVHGGEPSAYEVEFPDGKGGNLGEEISYTITAEFMRLDNETQDSDSGNSTMTPP